MPGSELEASEENAVSGLQTSVVGVFLGVVRQDSSDSRYVADLRVLDGIASWCGGLHGSMPLADALRALAVGLGARAAAISRHYHRTEGTPRNVALFPGASRPTLTKVFCQDVLDYQFGRARPGTVWFLSDMLDDAAWLPSHRLNSWLVGEGAKEVAVIPMAMTPQAVDYIEFHFDRDLDRAARHEIEALVPTVERSWTGRKPGLVTMALADGRTEIVRQPHRGNRLVFDAPILGMANPAGLSRAEFRVCLLLSRGLSVKSVSDELGLSENTVRSHLRAIYAKTDTSGLPELLYLILSVASDVERDSPLRVRA